MMLGARSEDFDLRQTRAVAQGLSSRPKPVSFWQQKAGAAPSPQSALAAFCAPQLHSWTLPKASDKQVPSAKECFPSPHCYI